MNIRDGPARCKPPRPRLTRHHVPEEPASGRTPGGEDGQSTLPSKRRCVISSCAALRAPEPLVCRSPASEIVAPDWGYLECIRLTSLHHLRVESQRFQTLHARPTREPPPLNSRMATPLFPKMYQSRGKASRPRAPRPAEDPSWPGGRYLIRASPPRRGRRLGWNEFGSDRHFLIVPSA